MSIDASPVPAAPPRQGRKILVTAILAVFVFAGLSFLSDVRALGDSLATFQWRMLGIALALVLGNYTLRFLRWQYLLNRLGVVVPAGTSALVFLSGFIMSVTPGKMGEVFKSFLLWEYRGISIARTASVVVAERLLDLVALVLLVSLGSTAFEHGRAVAFAGGLVVFGIVLGCTVRPIGEWGLGLLGRIKLTARLTPKLREAYDALHALTRPAPFLIGGLYALLGWALECLATWYLVQGFQGAIIGWDGATFSYAAGTLAGALAMLPGGLGVAEVGMTSLFRAASPTLPAATAAAATILVRLSTLWFGVALGAVALFVLRATHTKQVATDAHPSA
ncbi:MAG: lysylphosphatidylglycerol synthase transmembrane domain-containing protein [Polyangiales bacterium]